MAVVLICYKMGYKGHNLPTQNAGRQYERSLMCDCLAFPRWPRVSGSPDARMRYEVLYPATNILMKLKTRRGVNATKEADLNQGALHYQSMIGGPATHGLSNTKGGNFCMVCYASNSANEKQLQLLDSYFGKLEGDVNQTSLDSYRETTKILDKSDDIKAKEELDYLNAYLGKLNKDANLETYKSSAVDDQNTNDNPIAKPLSVSKDSRRDDKEKKESFAESRNKVVDVHSGRSRAFEQNVETSDLYLTGTLASINIAVFLFEIASPIRNSEYELFSIPLLYGAKINDLIIVGEWWRLVTPLFLHSGPFHVALGCWSLLTFGPKVCRAYGSFSFFLIYVLGGISGNLTSYLHTPEPSVGGTGPIFAIIGAWLIYQNQNRDVITKDVSDRMFQKAIITTGLSFILSHFGPIDDWTHLGAVLTGIVYGFFTCPTLQLDDASSRTGQDEGIALVTRHANPCKSLVIFSIIVLFLSSLLFILEPPLDTTVPDDFI